MKKVIYGFLFFALVGIVNVGCEKEETETPIVSDKQVTPSKIKNINNKSIDSDLENMAMAANIQDILYSSGIYTISFYGSIPDHIITINSFDENDIIDYDVLVQGESLNNEINANTKTINIETIGNYTFSEYEDYTISLSATPIKNIMPVIVAHHLINPNESLSFSDNGDDDVFNPDPANNPERRRFFGPKTNYTPCAFNSRQKCKNFYVFWTRVYHDCEPVPC